MAALPYTPVFRAGDWSCVSGQIGIDDDGLADGFDGQLAQILTNLDRLLDEHGVRTEQVAKTTVFVTDMDDYARMNELYVDYFGEHRPARSAVAVAALPIGAGSRSRHGCTLG